MKTAGKPDTTVAEIAMVISEAFQQRSRVRVTDASDKEADKRTVSTHVTALDRSTIMFYKKKDTSKAFL